MTAKQRIKQLEKTHTAGAARAVVWWDETGVDGLASFDGVKMTPEEAKAKAAAMPDNVLVIHVCYASEAIKDGGE